MRAERDLFAEQLRCHGCGKVLSVQEYDDGNGYCQRCTPAVEGYSMLLGEPGGLAKYKALENMRLIDLECKHVMYETEINASIIDDALGATHGSIQWGLHRAATIDTERAIVNQMVQDRFMRPFRVTQTVCNAWADNTHTVISWIVRLGSDALVGDVPHYVCDVSILPPTIAGPPKWIDLSPQAQVGALVRATRLARIEEHGGRRDHWKIGDLCEQIGI